MSSHGNTLHPSHLVTHDLFMSWSIASLQVTYPSSQACQSLIEGIGLRCSIIIHVYDFTITFTDTNINFM